MKIDLKLSNDALVAAHNILKQVYNPSYPNEIQIKVYKSIGFELADKFEKKVKAQQKKASLFDQKKKISVTLKYYEAWALKAIATDLIYTCSNDYSKNLVQTLINVLDQKLQ
ncbi:hypothetical protein [Formosa sp. A9]|uniref:hypothetical protein n=1 Tax=Formosa sp. A9 TaxID=3442641 RepID=UPI003EBAD9B3